MTNLQDLFTARKKTRIESHKRSTTKTRDNEYKRIGLDAGILKIRTKWRGRKWRAIRWLLKNPTYEKLEVIDGDLCRKYIDQLECKFAELRDAELQRITQIWATRSEQRA